MRTEPKDPYRNGSVWILEPLHPVKMISEGSYYTEDRGNDADNSAAHHMNQIPL